MTHPVQLSNVYGNTMFWVPLILDICLFHSCICFYSFSFIATWTFYVWSVFCAAFMRNKRMIIIIIYSSTVSRNRNYSHGTLPVIHWFHSTFLTCRHLWFTSKESWKLLRRRPDALSVRAKNATKTNNWKFETLCTTKSENDNKSQQTITGEVAYSIKHV